MKAKEIFPPLPKSIWTTSLADLEMTPQERAVRAQGEYNGIATKRFMAVMKRRQAIEQLRKLAQQSPTETLQQGNTNSPLPVQPEPTKPAHTP